MVLPEITFESSYMSTESTGMVASTYHRNGCPIELGILFIILRGGVSKPLGLDAKIALPIKRKFKSLVNAGKVDFAPIVTTPARE